MVLTLLGSGGEQIDYFIILFAPYKSSLLFSAPDSLLPEIIQHTQSKSSLHIFVILCAPEG